jgi:hypothetical protein
MPLTRAGFKEPRIYWEVIKMSELETTVNVEQSTEATEKTFSEADVNRIVQERLARVKKEVPEDYEELKGISEELDGFGYSGTPAEKRAILKAQREEQAKQKELSELQEEADQKGASPELLSEIKQLKNEIAELKGEREAVKQAEKEKKSADEAFNKQVNEFNESYPDVDLAKVGENPKFLKFAKGRAGTLAELYSDFVDFVGETEKELETLKKTMEAKEANQKNAETSTGSVKGDKPTADFISFETFEKNKHDQRWVMSNLPKINQSRAKW